MTSAKSSGESPQSEWDVVGLGANSVDYVHLLATLPQASGDAAKIKIDRQLILCGGQTATTMCACANLGLRAKYVGVTGNDVNGARVRTELAGRGIDVSGVIVREAANQFATILVDRATGERIVLWDRDERLLLEASEVPVETITQARVLHVDDVDQPAAIQAALVARQHGIPTTSDIDRLTELTPALIDAVSIPIFAEHVPASLTGLSHHAEALRALRRDHHQLLCVTLGAQGAAAIDEAGTYRSPGFRVAAVDTTGAGDIFRAAFIVALLEGLSTPDILRFANAAAAVSCTRFGALGGIPTRDEIDGMLKHGLGI